MKTETKTTTTTTTDDEVASQTATAAITELAQKFGGTITPEIVLQEAKQEASPLHRFFCWDDTAAALEYRRIQASMLIRRVKVTVEAGCGRHVRVRHFINVVEPTGREADDDVDEQGINARPRGIYVDLDTALSTPDYREQLLRQCKRDVETFRAKYHSISEVAGIIDAMESFI
jgi:hypothetical protein